MDICRDTRTPMRYEKMENIGFGSHCENQLFYKTPDLPHSMASLQSHQVDPKRLEIVLRVRI